MSFIFRRFSQNCEKRLLTSSCLSVRPSVCPQGTTRLSLDRFLWNLIFKYFSINVKKIHVFLKSDKNKAHFIWRPIYIFLIVSRSILLRTKNVSDKFVAKIKTHFMFRKFFFRISCYLWDNVESYCRAGQAADGKTTHAHCILYN